jgi:hypothetical protein
MTTLILAGIAGLLFALAFVTKRRFGVLGLGLSAGALLSGTWSTQVASFLESQHIQANGFSSQVIAVCLLTLAPALLLLIGGPTYHKKLLALVGSIGFALLGILLVLGPISPLINAPSNIQHILDLAAKYQPGLVALGVALAVIDMFLARSPSKFGRGRHASH